MNDFIKNEAVKFAKIVNANTRDYEKLVNLNSRFEKELSPLIDIKNKLEFLNYLYEAVKDVFKKHISECKKYDTCPQHKTYNNSLFLISQAKELITNRSADMQTNKQTEYSLDIFISHSSQDAEIVKLLIEIIRFALNISADKIRCTSVNGYKLSVGASTDEQLKSEIFGAKVLIGVISPNSINSIYVAFELGARWGNNLPLFPLITNKMGAELLKGPLKNINALNSCNRADLFQLISDLGKALDKRPEQPSVYESKIDELVRFSLKETLPVDNLVEDKSPSLTSQNDLGDTDIVIKEYCQKEWPDDYSMQLHCIKQQKEAVKELKKPKPNDISESEFAQIRKKAYREWPTDFFMQLHAQNTQIDSLRNLRDQ